jgi:secondary thiamine-phosphate synthase enzyme
LLQRIGLSETTPKLQDQLLFVLSLSARKSHRIERICAHWTLAGEISGVAGELHCDLSCFLAFQREDRPGEIRSLSHDTPRCFHAKRPRVEPVSNKRFVASLCRFWFALRSMKSLTERLWFEIPHRRGYVNITDKVAALVRRSGVKEGLCLVNAMHISASVFINDNEEGLLHDFDVWLERLAPHAPITQYRHNLTGEDNADAHLKRQVMGREVVIAITNGELDFGPWEQIFYGEFDGRRRKAVLVKIIGE